MDEWGDRDSVTEVTWNKNGSMLAAADMAGNIKVWKYPSYRQVWSFELGQDMLWRQWHAVYTGRIGGLVQVILDSHWPRHLIFSSYWS